MLDNEERFRNLLRGLRTLRVEGPSLGGPHVGITHNEVTRAILSEGKGMIPLLLERLRESTLDEAIFIVFLLRELRAKEAKEAIRHLQSSNRFENETRDLTLDMQIQFFLRDVDAW